MYSSYQCHNHIFRFDFRSDALCYKRDAYEKLPEMKCKCCCQWFFNCLTLWMIVYIEKNVYNFFSDGGCGDNHFGWDYNLGWNYVGRISKTASGYDCQRWDSQTPHVHSLTDQAKFVDNSLDEARNYCRYYHEEVRSVGYIWCVTMEPNIIWEHCPLHLTICRK